MGCSWTHHYSSSLEIFKSGCNIKDIRFYRDCQRFTEFLDTHLQKYSIKCFSYTLIVFSYTRNNEEEKTRYIEERNGSQTGTANLYETF